MLLFKDNIEKNNTKPSSKNIW